MRQFSTGATRDSDTSKLDYESFLSPFALKRYAEYLNSHRVQADGKIRDGDNWQMGIPRVVYMKSLLRHLIDAWTIHRGGGVVDQKDGHIVHMDEALCAVIFNAMGYLHEIEVQKTKDEFASDSEDELDDNGYDSNLFWGDPVDFASPENPSRNWSY